MVYNCFGYKLYSYFEHRLIFVFLFGYKLDFMWCSYVTTFFIFAECIWGVKEIPWKDMDQPAPLFLCTQNGERTWRSLIDKSQHSHLQLQQRKNLMIIHLWLRKRISNTQIFEQIDKRFIRKVFFGWIHKWFSQKNSGNGPKQPDKEHGETIGGEENEHQFPSESMKSPSYTLSSDVTKLVDGINKKWDFRQHDGSCGNWSPNLMDEISKSCFWFVLIFLSYYHH